MHTFKIMFLIVDDILEERVFSHDDILNCRHGAWMNEVWEKYHADENETMSFRMVNSYKD